MTPDERNERLEEMAVAMTALLGAAMLPTEPDNMATALAFGMLLRPDVARVFPEQADFARVYHRLFHRMQAHAASHKDA